MVRVSKEARKGETETPALTHAEVCPTIEAGDMLASISGGDSENPVVTVTSRRHADGSDANVSISLDHNAIAAIRMARELDRLEIYFDEIDADRRGFDSVLLHQAIEKSGQLREIVWEMAQSAISCCI